MTQRNNIRIGHPCFPAILIMYNIRFMPWGKYEKTGKEGGIYV